MSSSEHPLAGSGRAPVYPDSGPEPWKPEIVEVIYGLLYRDDLGVGALVAALQELEEREGPVVFVELLYLLTDIRFEPDDARKHWDAVILHRQELVDRGTSCVARVEALVTALTKGDHAIQCVGSQVNLSQLGRPFGGDRPRGRATRTDRTNEPLGDDQDE